MLKKVEGKDMTGKTKKNISLVNLINISSVKFCDIAEMFLLAKRAELLSMRSIQLYEYQLNLFDKFLRQKNISLVSEITMYVLQSYISELAQTHKPRTCHISFRVLRTLTYWFENYTNGDYVSPMHKMRAPKLPKDKKSSCNLDDFSRLLSGCDGCNEKRDKALLMLAFDSGLRKGEIIALNIENIDAVTGRIEVICGKGDKYRTAFISQPTLRAIREYLKERGNLNDYDPLFTSTRDIRFSEQGLTSLLKRVQKRARIDIHGFHSLRRGFAREFIVNGGGMFQLQQLMGHEDISTTQNYVGLDEKDIEQAHRKASPMNRLK